MQILFSSKVPTRAIRAVWRIFISLSGPLSFFFFAFPPHTYRVHFLDRSVLLFIWLWIQFGFLRSSFNFPCTNISAAFSDSISSSIFFFLYLNLLYFYSVLHSILSHVSAAPSPFSGPLPMISESPFPPFIPHWKTLTLACIF